MAADVLILPTRADDVEALIANLRPADLAECRAYGRSDIGAGIRSSVARSMWCWSGFINGELAAILGVAPINTMLGIGSPWMLGTPVLDQHARVLVRRAPDYIALMSQAFPHLFNLVHAKNTTSIRWLRKLGFTLHEPVPYGAPGEMFHPFEMKTDV